MNTLRAKPTTNPRVFNLGVNFVSMFRWLLLLLFALLIEKAAEGVTYRVSGQPINVDLRVYTPLFGSPEDPTKILIMPHWQYLVGVLQMIVTLLFAARYFLCLVDPLERISGIHSDNVEITDLDEIKTALQHIRMWHVILVLCVAIPEFLLLYHAATSFGSYHQWISFLLLLVLWDSLLFFVVVGSLHQGVRSLIWLEERSLRIRYWLLRHRHAARLYMGFVRRLGRGRTVTALLTQFRQERRSSRAKHKEKKKRYEAIKEQLKTTRTDYGPWNLFDAFVLLICLMGEHCYHNTKLSSLIGIDWLHRVLPTLFVVLMLVMSIWLTRKCNVKTLNRLKLRHWVIGAMFIILLSALMYFDSRHSWSSAAGGSEFLVLSTICAAIAYFSGLNYWTQPELWERHLRMLQLKP